MKYRTLNSQITRMLGASMAVCLLFACNEDQFTIGKNFVRSDVYTELIDTVSLRFSTLRPDSIPTSGKSAALIGAHSYKSLGRVVSSSYVDYSKSDVSDFQELEVIDSVALVLAYNNYYEGDTLTNFKFSVYRLTEIIDSNNDDDAQLYNNSSFAHEPTPLVSYTISPRPNSSEKLYLRLPDELGAELRKAVEDELVDDTFHEQFKGLAIKVDPTSTNTMLAFKVDTSSMIINLYTHIIKDKKENIVRTFDVRSTSTQFNQIESSPTETVLGTLSEEKRWITEYATNGRSFVQAGTGFLTRIDFPYLAQLKEAVDNGRVVKATLVVAPDMEYQDLNDLPSSINIGTIDKVNYVGSYLTDSYSSNLTGNLVKDDGYNENTFYSFDITSYINTRLADDVILPDQGLFLTIPTSEFYSTVKTLTVGGYTNTKYKSHVEIYYYNYDKD